MNSRNLVLVLCAAAALTTPVWALTVDEIINNNIEAKGGAEAWQQVETAHMSGTMQMMGGAAGAIEVPFSVDFKRPHKIRLEYTMQGMTAIQAFDGTIGWTIMPFLGKTQAEEMAEDQLKDLKDRADFEGALIDYEKKGHTVELLGHEEVDGTPAYKLKVTKDNGDIDTLYLDEEYFIEFKMDAVREIQGAEITVSTVLGDYKEVEGLMMAHSMEVQLPGGARQVITIDSVEFGVDLPDERFAMPPKQETDEPNEG